MSSNKLEFAVEKCTRADYDFIVEHISDFWGSDRTLHAHHPIFIEELSKFAIVVRKEESVVGYHFGFIAECGTTFYTHLVAVHENYRRRGIAELIYDEIEEACRLAGLRMIKAITTPKNEKSLEFHKARGFEFLGEQNENGISIVPNYSAPGKDMCVMMKYLL